MSPHANHRTTVDRKPPPIQRVAGEVTDTSMLTRNDLDTHVVPAGGEIVRESRGDCGGLKEIG